MKLKKTDEDLDITREQNGDEEKCETLEPIEHILKGPALVVIGSQEFRDRNIIQEQMAVAIATEKPFLNHFETQHPRVLILRNGKADYNRTNQRIDKIFNGLKKNRPVVERIEDWVKLEATVKLIGKSGRNVWDEATDKFINIPLGLLEYLENCFEKYEYDVVFIPEYSQIHTGVSNYLHYGLLT